MKRSSLYAYLVQATIPANIKKWFKQPVLFPDPRCWKRGVKEWQRSALLPRLLLKEHAVGNSFNLWEVPKGV